MKSKMLGIAAMALGCAGLAGCSNEREARYVYRDGQYGVIGLPLNTADTRRQAERMMEKHFPEGYVIVREEEVDAGARTSNLDKAQSSGIKPGAGMANLVVGLGESSRSSSEKYQDQLKLHESRIIYKKKTEAPAANYTQVANLSPEMYFDPNAQGRQADAAKTQVASAAAKADPSVQKASTDR